MSAVSKNNEQTSDYLSYYLTSNAHLICRICLEKATRLVPIFDPNKPPHFSILIMACASVEVTLADDLPPNICTKCISRLNLAFQFKTQCEMADAKLRQAVQNMVHIQESQATKQVQMEAPTENNELKMGEFLYNDCLTGNQVKFELADTSAGGNINIEIYSCDSADDTENNQIENAINAASGTTYTSVLPSQVPDVSNIQLPKTYELNVNEPKASRVTNQIMGQAKCNSQNNVKSPLKVIKEHQCHICDKTFRTKPSLIHHIRIHTGERPYVCHLCDKRFINGGHLHTHMRTHTGQKDHVCAACPKAFATAQQLTKHTIAIHTAERPYCCSICPKRFASSSNLNTHNKIHTGEKNYYCDQCGKAFSTKGQLLQHMLVHSGEKAYLCEFCQKRFTQKAHLVRHLKMHQKMSDK